MRESNTQISMSLELICLGCVSTEGRLEPMVSITVLGAVGTYTAFPIDVG